MSDFNPYFLDPCELVAIVYGSDGITELGRYSFQGYMRGINLFSQICSLLSYEGAHSYRYAKVNFKNYASILRSSFYGAVKKGEVKNLKNAIQRRIDDLRQYKFMARKIFPTLPKSSATSLNHNEFEITIDYIFNGILKMRKERIAFYESILKEYKARNGQYDSYLREFLENNKQRSVINSSKLDINSILSDLWNESSKQDQDNYKDSYYEIRSQSWYLEDLIKLENPEIERYTKKLPRYRTNEIHTHLEGLIAFFEIFSVFKEEMSLILPDNPDESFFERVLSVLKRDFINKLEKHGDLENIIIEYIEGLEKLEFLSLSKEKLFDRLSKMIYSLREHRIKYYETILEDYLANKEEYDKVM